ncbi:CNNM domain-containing protein, partial [Escherichia coli]
LMPGFAYAGNIGTALAVSLITFITLIFGELVPKRLALTRSEAIAGLVAMPMSWLAKLALPFVWLLSRTTQLVLRL